MAEIAELHRPDMFAVKPLNYQDILDAYMQTMFARAGYSEVITADSREYHNNVGDIHCGTNVVRVIPGYNWWE